jgi:steroid delta-isomerase-like uncharacterized protein
MSAETNKAVVQRFYEEAFDRHNMNVIEEVIAPDWVNHDPSLPPLSGHDGARRLLGMFYGAFPDFRGEVEEIIADGNEVAVRTRFTGTHRGELLGIPATGRQVNVAQAAVHRVVDGKITDNWVVFDALGLMQQLGVAPAPGR